MEITIKDNKIKIGDIFYFNDDGSDITEDKLLELLEKITKKEEIKVDTKLTGDDFSKCSLIKEIMDIYITNYFK